jgi:hypothetical protein
LVARLLVMFWSGSISFGWNALARWQASEAIDPGTSDVFQLIAVEAVVPLATVLIGGHKVGV